LASSWISYNASKAPLDNAMLRLALSKSIDRNLLVDNVEHGLGAPQQTFIPKGMNGYDASDSSQSFDVAAAKADLAASGVAMAQVNALKFLTRNSTGRAAVNTFIVNQWNTNLGTNIQLDVLDSNTVTIRIRKGQYDIYGVDGWISGYPDDQPWFDLFVSGSCHSLNWGCPTLPGYDTLVNQADSELDPTQRAKDYAAAQKMLVDQAVVGFLYQSYSYNLIKPYVGGLTVTPGDDGEVPGDLFLNDAYITAH
jgi:ABC-type transport system substrate-binding protein